jgi:D-glycero-D-manno-heptose 1,7-bisphosphate phosphatase
MTATGQNRCVFLDRDGVINEGMNINVPEDFVLVAGVKEAITKLKKAGFLVIVVSNQGGLGEGHDGSIIWKNHPLTREALAAIHVKMVTELGPEAALDDINFCPHFTKLGCECRKPKPGMIKDAAAKFGIDLARSVMVGDRETDVQTGIAAGVTPLFVLSGPDSEEQKQKVPAGTLIFPSLVEAADWILASK